MRLSSAVSVGRSKKTLIHITLCSLNRIKRRVIYLPLQTFEASAERSSSALQSNHEGTSIFLEKNIYGCNAQQLFLVFSSQNRKCVYPFCIIHFIHYLIYKWTIWFHNIISKAVSVVLITMKNAKCWEHS